MLIPRIKLKRIENGQKKRKRNSENFSVVVVVELFKFKNGTNWIKII